MPRNYDTTSHRPYPRITDIDITYSSAGVPRVEYVERTAVVDGNGDVQHIGANGSRYVLDFASITEPVQVVHPATGQPIPGQTVTTQQLLLGLLAFLRADQLARDARVDAAMAAQNDAVGTA